MRQPMRLCDDDEPLKRVKFTIPLFQGHFDLDFDLEWERRVQLFFLLPLVFGGAKDKAC